MVAFFNDEFFFNDEEEDWVFSFLKKALKVERLISYFNSLSFLKQLD